MSNHLAAAAVTAALKQMIQDALDVDVPGAKAQVGRPEAGGENDVPLVNILLYQATPNAAARNAPMPSRRGDGGARGSSAVALDLHYLLSFIGDASKYAPEILLGSVARALEHKPIITRAAIEKAIDENPGLLDEVDLHRAPETVRIHPASLSLDDLSKLWSVLFQVPYVFSVAYVCSPLMIETRDAGSSGPPVTRVGIGSLIMGGPSIDAVEAAAGGGMPITWGGMIAIRGRGLDSAGLMLRIGGVEADLTTAKITANRIELPLAAATFGASELKAGPVLVEAVLPPPSGMGAHMERVCDRATFVLRAKAGSVNVAAGQITVGVTPKIQKGQQVALTLDGQALAGARSYRLAPGPLEDADYPAAALTFAFDTINPDTYYVQLVVDGTASAPQMETDPQNPAFREIVGPKAVLP